MKLIFLIAGLYIFWEFINRVDPSSENQFISNHKNFNSEGSKLTANIGSFIKILLSSSNQDAIIDVSSISTAEKDNHNVQSEYKNDFSINESTINECIDSLITFLPKKSNVKLYWDREIQFFISTGTGKTIPQTMLNRLHVLEVSMLRTPFMKTSL